MLLNKLKFLSCETGPNQQADDAWLAFRLLFFPWLTNFKQSEREVGDWFGQYFKLPSGRELYFTDSGRTALYLLLKSLKLPADTEVLIQGFSCVLVPNAVLQAGYKPVICDIDQQTYNFDLQKLEPRISSKTRVWIVQHTFGLLLDMSRVQKICQKHDLILIEDCAHSLGSEQNGQKAGTFGQAAIFSFGRDKIVSSTMGGLALINTTDLKWRARLKAEYNQLAAFSKKKERQALWFTLLAGWLLPFYHWGVGKLALSLSLKLRLIPAVYTPQEAQGTDQFHGRRYSPPLAKLLDHQLTKFTQFKRHRQRLAKIYCQELNLRYFPDSAYLRFPLNLEELTPNCSNYPQLYDTIIRNLRQEGVFAGLWYQRLFITEAELSKFNYQPNSNPTTERLLQKRVLNLPTNIKVSAQDALRITDAIQKALTNLKLGEQP